MRLPYHSFCPPTKKEPSILILVVSFKPHRTFKAWGKVADFKKRLLKNLLHQNPQPKPLAQQNSRMKRPNSIELLSRGWAIHVKISNQQWCSERESFFTQSRSRNLSTTMMIKVAKTAKIVFCLAYTGSVRFN